MLQRLISSKTPPKQSRWKGSTAAKEKNMYLHCPFNQSAFLELEVVTEISFRRICCRNVFPLWIFIKPAFLASLHFWVCLSLFKWVSIRVRQYWGYLFKGGPFCRLYWLGGWWCEWEFWLVGTNASNTLLFGGTDCNMLSRSMMRGGAWTETRPLGRMGQ